MKPIQALTDEARLKRVLRQHFRDLGFGRTSSGSLSAGGRDKEIYRKMHSIQRKERLEKQSEFLWRVWPKVKDAFANGAEVDVERIKPVLLPVNAKTLESDLFRVARLTWSIPTSNGFGRRMRFLVWDLGADKLMGIIALGDPVFNMKVRDDFVGWNHEDRSERLVNVMDAFVMGALPPYNMVLCGKLVACLIRSQEIKDHFKAKYANRKGVISQKKKRPDLVMVTTTSALGRSSVYNRLRIEGVDYLKSLGYTSGWGHFHVSEEIFNEMRNFLRLKGHKYADGNAFGQGPNWKLRVLRTTLSLLGMNENVLNHGLKREVFASELAENASDVLLGSQHRPEYRNLESVSEISEKALKRWVRGRAKRDKRFREWRSSGIQELLKLSDIKQKQQEIGHV